MRPTLSDHFKECSLFLEGGRRVGGRLQVGAMFISTCRRVGCASVVFRQVWQNVGRSWLHHVARGANVGYAVQTGDAQFEPTEMTAAYAILEQARGMGWAARPPAKGLGLERTIRISETWVQNSLACFYNWGGIYRNMDAGPASMIL